MRRWIGTGRRRPDGQMLVIFAGSLIALMMLSALVVDVGWYWSSGLKMQRAADAAALAGAVYLPDNYNGTAPNAQTTALAAAKRNGFDPTNSTMTTWVDVSNPRQLDVSIGANVDTLFLKAVGMPTLHAVHTSKAEFVLPVPMGSPQNYYGVGNFLNMVTPAPQNNAFVNPSTYVQTTQTTGVRPGANTQVGATGTAWTSPANAQVAETTPAFATATANLIQTVWKTFAPATFGTFQTGAVIDGVVVNVKAKVSTAAAACKLKAEVSWNGGVVGSWGDLPLTTATLTTTNAWYTLGSATTTWSSGANPWTPAAFTTAGAFQVRVTYLKGTSCGTGSLDVITAAVYSHTVTTFAAVETLQTSTGPGGATLAGGSQGFWGADITLGGDRGNGDQFDPSKDNGATNPDWDGKGVDYTVVVGAAGGQVQLYDPLFCETGQNSSGGYLGAGDHWIGGSPNPVTSVYSLYDEQGTPFDTSDDGPAKSTQTFTSTAADYSNAMGGDRKSDGTVAHLGLTDCSSNPAHNAWVLFASGLPKSTYRLNVTTNVSGNGSTNAENMWSAWVSGAGSRVYGEGTMVTYNNLLSGKQTFYLAQIDKVHAGKTMEIKLFDPGDVTGGAWMRILSPDGNVYTPVSFTYAADSNAAAGHQSGTGSCIQTNGGATTGLTPPAACANLTSGGNFYQDSLITVAIPLPVTYGSVGLTPSGEPGAGWWKIEYWVGGGNDTTTWQVDIRGNPVHLLVP
jgi:hypothetical protein